MLEKSEGTCEKGNEYQCTPKHFYINKKNLKNQQVRPYISQPKLHFESIETDNIFDYGNPKICIKLELEDNNSGVDDARSNHKRLKNHLEAGKSADLKNQRSSEKIHNSSTGGRNLRADNDRLKSVLVEIMKKVFFLVIKKQKPNYEEQRRIKKVQLLKQETTQLKKYRDKTYESQIIGPIPNTTDPNISSNNRNSAYNSYITNHIENQIFFSYCQNPNNLTTNILNASHDANENPPGISKSTISLKFNKYCVKDGHRNSGIYMNNSNLNNYYLSGSNACIDNTITNGTNGSLILSNHGMSGLHNNSMLNTFDDLQGSHFKSKFQKKQIQITKGNSKTNNRYGSPCKTIGKDSMEKLCKNEKANYDLFNSKKNTGIGMKGKFKCMDTTSSKLATKKYVINGCPTPKKKRIQPKLDKDHIGTITKQYIDKPCLNNNQLTLCIS